MLMPKKVSNAIQAYLFKEGVLCCPNNVHLAQHPIIPVPNLFVMKLMQSFESKGFVVKKFVWQHFYYHLTDEGIEELRKRLNLPANVMPLTLQKQTNDDNRGPGGRSYGGDRGGRFGDRGPRRDGGRDDYRGGKKDSSAPSGFAPEFGGRPALGNMRGTAAASS